MRERLVTIEKCKPHIFIIKVHRKPCNSRRRQAYLTTYILAPISQYKLFQLGRLKNDYGILIIELQFERAKCKR